MQRHGVARREFDMIAAWSVDRLGRSLQDLLAFLLELQSKRVDLYLHQQALDTSTPMGKAMFQLCGVFAELERSIIQERVKAGLERARVKGKILGRPSPIDPQVPTEGGRRFVPAQALWLLVERLEKDGRDAIAKGEPIPWTAVRIVDTIDKKELGEAITASDYSRKMVQEFLVKYKFRNWAVRSASGEPVTEEYKRIRAIKIADELCSHERWKSHGHAINRDVLWSELQLKIEHPKDAFLRAITRTWALVTFIFDKTSIQKMFFGPDYAFIRFTPQPEGGS